LAVFWVYCSLGAVLVIYGVTLFVLSRSYPEPNWDWTQIDTSKLDFPPDFEWGAAVAAHQVEGGNHNNWSEWEKRVDASGNTPIQHGDVSGQAADQWNRYPEDVRRMKEELGLNGYRFSIEWSRIEPEQGRFDEAAIAHYHAVLDALHAAGIAPMVTIHHFTHPVWFEELGAFEKAENIPLFLRFAEKVFSEYEGKVSRWCTFNEIGPYSVMGYGLGVFPPGVKSYRRMAQVMRNVLVTHVQTYRLLKSLPGGDEAQIGLAKNIFQFDPYRRWNLIHWVQCRVMDNVFNQTILTFLKTGHFHLHIPGRVRMVETIPDAGGCLDFIGLNYYSTLLISLFMKKEPPFEPNLRPFQIRADMPYAIYGEGFHRALHRISQLEKPIWVTENGIADAKDDRRALWIQRYLYALNKAREEGCDVRGYYYWSLIDNFEWAEGYAMRFGLYEVDFSTQERRLRDGSQAYVDVIRASRSGQG